jgi:hypothetical protein
MVIAIPLLDPSVSEAKESAGMPSVRGGAVMVGSTGPAEISYARVGTRKVDTCPEIRHGGG